jgi:hypothetical protein
VVNQILHYSPQCLIKFCAMALSTSKSRSMAHAAEIVWESYYMYSFIPHTGP